MRIIIKLCIVLFSVLGSIEAIALDRLFTSAKERQLLDSRRYGREQAKGDGGQTQTQSLQLNGVVTVDRKQPTIWLNGSPADESGTELNPESNRKSIELFLPAKQLNVTLKPGQQLDLITGRRLEAFNVPRAAADNTASDGEAESSQEQLLSDEPGAQP